MDLAVQAAQVIDLPSGGFLVIDKITGAYIEGPWRIALYSESPFFKVHVITTEGADVVAASWRTHPDSSLSIGTPDDPQWQEAKASAEAWLAALRVEIGG